MSSLRCKHSKVMNLKNSVNSSEAFTFCQSLSKSNSLIISSVSTTHSLSKTILRQSSNCFSSASGSTSLRSFMNCSTWSQPCFYCLLIYYLCIFQRTMSDLMSYGPVSLQSQSFQIVESFSCINIYLSSSTLFKVLFRVFSLSAQVFLIFFIALISLVNSAYFFECVRFLLFISSADLLVELRTPNNLSTSVRQD